MKKLLLLLVTSFSFAQGGGLIVGTSLDVRNAIFGSSPTKNNPELDYIIKFGMVGHNNVEVDIIYEKFQAIGFDKFAFGVGYQLNVSDKLTVVPIIEPSLIGRNWSKQYGADSINGGKSSHLSIGFSLPLRYKINDAFYLELQSNALYRTDLGAKYNDAKFVFSNFLVIF